MFAFTLGLRVLRVRRVGGRVLRLGTQRGGERQYVLGQRRDVHDALHDQPVVVWHQEVKVRLPNFICKRKQTNNEIIIVRD